MSDRADRPFTPDAIDRLNHQAKITDRERSAALGVADRLGAPDWFELLDDGLVLRWRDGLDIYLIEGEPG